MTTEQTRDSGKVTAGQTRDSGKVSTEQTRDSGKVTKGQRRVCRESLLGPGPQLADPQSANSRSPPPRRLLLCCETVRLGRRALAPHLVLAAEFWGRVAPRAGAVGTGAGWTPGAVGVSGGHPTQVWLAAARGRSHMGCVCVCACVRVCACLRPQTERSLSPLLAAPVLWLSPCSPRCHQESPSLSPFHRRRLRLWPTALLSPS